MELRAWPFEEPRDYKVLTTLPILAGELPILAIVHESGAARWRFVDLESGVEGICLATLEEVVEMDEEIWEVAADLPVHSRAQRASVNDPWIREYWAESSISKKRRQRKTPRSRR